jgi:preprotein translocase subunit SecB
MTERKKINVTTKLLNIELINFIVPKITKQQLSKLDRQKFAYVINANIKQNNPQKEVVVIINIKVYADDTKILYIGEIETKGSFIIKNYEDLIFENKNVLPKDLITMYFSIMLSTTRGMLFILSNKTTLENAVLPIINPNTLFNHPNPQMKQL